MNQHKKKILNILLDWYEKSPAHAREETPSRRRFLRLYDGGKTDYPAYDIDRHEARKEINQAVRELAQEGFVHYQWMRGQEEYIISRLWLNFAKASAAYAYLGRRPAEESAWNVLEQIEALQEQVKENWARQWLHDMASKIEREKSIGHTLPADPDERNDLLKAVSFLAERRETEMLQRIFSMRCFGDSKHFERSVKKRVVAILKKYLVQDVCTDEEALQMAGIVRYPETFQIFGALSIVLPQGTVDFSPLAFGGALTVPDLDEGTIRIDSGVKRVLSIENFANYVDYIRKLQDKNEIALFHGGPFSPSKKIFLKRIVAAMPGQVPFYHWGDIDYGGFSMLARLRREISPDVRPWRMNEQELRQFASYTAKFSPEYGKRLSALLTVPELLDCHACISFMLKKGIRLEQEAMLTES